MTARLEVLVVDDSAVVRETMAHVLADAADVRVTTASNPIVARRKMALVRPDVILLDLEMPQEDGLTFLRDLMRRDPIPVVICSSHSTQGSRTALEALHEGAVEVVAKPRIAVREFVQESRIILLDAIRGAATARLRRPVAPVVARTRREPTLERGPASRRIVAIAASTGGPQALLEVLRTLPGDAPGVVVVQHMPAGFTTAFAKHLDERCTVTVREAQEGDEVRDGLVLIAPGGRHMSVQWMSGRFKVALTDGGLVSRHRPSADVLFHSIAGAAGADALGVIMTGMGDDGADGLVAMKAAGAATLAQDEASSVVFGMPKEAVARGVIDTVVPLTSLAEEITRWGSRRPAGLMKTIREER